MGCGVGRSPSAAVSSCSDLPDLLGTLHLCTPPNRSVFSQSPTLMTFQKMWPLHWAHPCPTCLEPPIPLKRIRVSTEAGQQPGEAFRSLSELCGAELIWGEAGKQRKGGGLSLPSTISPRKPGAKNSHPALWSPESLLSSGRLSECGRKRF